MAIKLHPLTEAVHALKEGKTVYRQYWNGIKLKYIPAADDRIESIQAELTWIQKKTTWSPLVDDILAEDWIIE